MIKRKTAIKIRRIHRYLGVFIGIQFIMWTVSGLYFSWTDLDEIHGDHYLKHHVEALSFEDLRSPAELLPGKEITSLELKEIAGEPFYFINSNLLINARNGSVKKEITTEEAAGISDKNLREGLTVKNVERIEEAGPHHEYRGGPFPAYVVTYNEPENVKAYVSARDGSFRTVRHRDWRWFDFLWMTHTMDYEGRDDFNNTLLRIFSLLALLAVLSGFVLWYISSPSVRKVRKHFLKRKP